MKIMCQKWKNWLLFGYHEKYLPVSLAKYLDHTGYLIIQGRIFNWDWRCIANLNSTMCVAS